jgi:hypothetical protein
MPNAQFSSCASPSQLPSYPSEDSLTSLIGVGLASSSQYAPQAVIMPTFGGNRSNQDLYEVLGQVLEIMDNDYPVSMDGMGGIFGSGFVSSPERGAKQ